MLERGATRHPHAAPHKRAYEELRRASALSSSVVLSSSLRCVRERSPGWRGRSRGSAEGSAFWAGPGDLDRMGDVEKTVLLARRSGPAFDFWSFDLDGAAAESTDQVVVMVATGAAAGEGF